MATISALPIDLFNRVYALGVYSFPHKTKPEQAEARKYLHAILTSGALDELPRALRRHGMAWNKNVQGRYIEGENWITGTAYALATEVDLLISSSRQLAA